MLRDRVVFAGSRNSHPGHSWPERCERPHLARIRGLHADSDGVAVGEEARAWRGPGGPSPAERGSRDVLRKNRSGAKYHGGCRGRAFALANCLPQDAGKMSADSRASPKLAQFANVREFRGKSRARLIPEI